MPCFFTNIFNKLQLMGPASTRLNNSLKEGNGHQYFQDVKVIKAENTIVTKIQISDLVNTHKWDELLAQCSKLDQTYLAIPSSYRVISKETCSSAGELELKFKHFQIFLSEELKHRHTQLKFFQEEEFWYILFTLACSSCEISKIGESLGDVRPQNIIVNEEGNLKLFCTASFPESVKGYIKTFIDHQVTLLSPEQILDCQLGRAEPRNFNPAQRQAFSIGMTLLSLGLLQNLSCLYTVQPFELNLKALTQKIEYWQQFDYFSNTKQRTVTYSHALKSVVKKLLDYHPEKRVTSLEVLNWLNPHLESIMKLKAFDIPAIGKSLQSKQNNLLTQKLEPHRIRQQQNSQQSKAYLSLGSKKRKTLSEKPEDDRHEKSHVLQKCGNVAITPFSYTANQYTAKSSQGQNLPPRRIQQIRVPIEHFSFGQLPYPNGGQIYLQNPAPPPITSTSAPYQFPNYPSNRGTGTFNVQQPVQPKSIDDIISKIENQLLRSKEQFPSKK